MPTNPQTSFISPSYQGKVPGMVRPGNIDINHRPNINNPDGSHSSVFSMSFGTDEGEVLVPGVGNGKDYPLRKLTTKEALDQYHKTGNNLGTFKTPKDADAYGSKLHDDLAKMPAWTGDGGMPIEPQQKDFLEGSQRVSDDQDFLKNATPTGYVKGESPTPYQERPTALNLLTGFGKSALSTAGGVAGMAHSGFCGEPGEN